MMHSFNIKFWNPFNHPAIDTFASMLRNTIFNVPIASTCRERWFSDNFNKTLRVEELQDFICTMVIHREVI
ncbi:hypothetical protein MTE1_5319 [Klebsiella pneumoniae JHCK1]|nr:hypothetical protein MTE1_5319 [Klebsiella pneumoniae JHCK1]